MSKDLKNYYKDRDVYDNINYEILDVNVDRKRLEYIRNLDNKNMCFGCYDFDILIGLLADYYNLEVYYKDIFIGYIGWCIFNNIVNINVIPTIIIKEEYRNMGFGDILLKKFINTAFLDYYVFDNIYIPIDEFNYVSIKLAQKNKFKEFEGYRKKDYKGLRRQKYYLYTRDDFKKNRKYLEKYGHIF